MSQQELAIIGAGAVGQAVVRRLVERGIEPTVINRSETTLAGARSVSADVGDAAGLRRALAGADVVFQCAQPPYHRWSEDFPQLQSNVVDACTETGAALIGAENLYAYGTPGTAISEQSPFQPTTQKGRVRLAMIEALRDADQAGRLRTAAVRASDFFGPGVTGSAYGDRFFGPIAAGKKAQLLGDPDALHSITFIDDYAETLVRVALDPTSWGRAWIAPTAPPITQRAILEIAAQAAGTAPRFQKVGATTLRVAGLFSPPAKEMIEMLGEFTSDYLVDSTAAEKRFGFSPTPLVDAIAITMAAHTA